MPHEETVRLVDGATVAVLFMHGIAGTPNHFRTLLPLEQMIPADWSVYNVLLPGHGKKVEDFARSSMAQWKSYVNEIFNKLCDTHEKVILVGHSMGTLFSVEMALKRPEKIPFLFLIASPMVAGVKPFGVANMLKLGCGLLDMNDPIQEATSKVSSIGCSASFC
jgi:esterase/lipase